MKKWEVDVTRVEAWLLGLGDEAYDHTLAAIEYLEHHGPTAGRPYVDRVEGSEHHNMKELRSRPTSTGEVVRVLFAFDAESRAITLVGGDKAGNWKGWYDQNIPIADGLFTAHQAEVRARVAANTQQTKKRKKNRRKR
ncbi:type II toxin-antitoxin system RelE/ParE family toxin [Gordonia sp. FQ]|uniref:type II toxin-antitoxin system RelE/ParE family toxin n=1 Tax=Gordonia sp. FQ TaxID=3446634 RepID=UPI003F871DB3